MVALNVLAAAYGAFQETARYFRKASAGQRFDRERAQLPLEKKITDYWRKGTDSMFAWLGMNGGWEKIQRQVQLTHAAGSFAKSLSDHDRQLLVDLLRGWGHYNDLDDRSAMIIKATSFDTFEDAARFALGQLGVKATSFELRDPQLQQKLLDRTGAAVFATRNNIESTFSTIIQHFYDLGQNPYNASFLADLKKDLGITRDYQAKRFALTETGIAAELAQAETYRRNGVTGKQWNVTGDNTRATHEELSGVTVGMDQPFDVGGNLADHPLDPTLPAEELVNCHCWLSPVVNPDFEINPNSIWEGA